jgi:hypothetical protein
MMDCDNTGQQCFETLKNNAMKPWKKNRQTDKMKEKQIVYFIIYIRFQFSFSGDTPFYADSLVGTYGKQLITNKK